jgi:hypothetical protein
VSGHPKPGLKHTSSTSTSGRYSTVASGHVFTVNIVQLLVNTQRSKSLSDGIREPPLLVGLVYNKSTLAVFQALKQLFMMKWVTGCRISPRGTCVKSAGLKRPPGAQIRWKSDFLLISGKSKISIGNPISFSFHHPRHTTPDTPPPTHHPRPPDGSPDTNPDTDNFSASAIHVIRQTRYS